LPERAKPSAAPRITKDGVTVAKEIELKSGEFGNLVTKGIIDPTKVVRIALQDGASIAATLRPLGPSVRRMASARMSIAVQRSVARIDCEFDFLWQPFESLLNFWNFVFAAPTAAANDIEAGLGVETFVKLWNDLMGVITSKSTVLKRAS
jgi:hypothetical protein